MLRVIRLAAAYWSGIFALGFVLGAIRMTLIVPLMDEFGAVLLELPFMLAASWLWAGRLLRRHPLAPGAALAMGVLAFALLMASEIALASLAFGQAPAEWLAGFARPAGMLALAGQALFGAIPWLRSRSTAPGA